MSLCYFGRRYNAPAWEAMTEVPRPVGEPCTLCPEPIGPTDDGVTMSHVEMEEGRPVAYVFPQHVECHLRMILGVLGSLDGSPPDYDDVSSLREQARQTMAWVLRNNSSFGGLT